MIPTFEDDADQAARLRRENKTYTDRLLQGLPKHRQLINRIVQHGLQPI